MIVICPSVILFPDIFATITLIHKQIIAVAGYACGAFIYSLQVSYISNQLGTFEKTSNKGCVCVNYVCIG